MEHICSFSYAAFTLSSIYLVLFILVVRYLLNLIRQNSVKKRAQKLFLGILLAQTLLRVLYFAMFPFINSTCDPSLKGHDGHDMHGAEWWVHLLSNVPAALFLMAFSVLVYTFARIYHRVLLAGVWFQERRFRMLTIVLGLLNVIALVAVFGDWAYAANNDSNMEFFVDLLLYTILSVSFVLALFFLAYGALLFYQVQSIIRASGENADGASAGLGGLGYAPPQMHTAATRTPHAEYAQTNTTRYVPRTPQTHQSSLLPSGTLDSEGTTGFTPTARRAYPSTTADPATDSQGQVQSSPSVTLGPGGINLPAGVRQNGGTGFGSSSRDAAPVYPLAGFASPTLPIQSGMSHTTAGGSIAHSYVSASSFSPEGVEGGVAAGGESEHGLLPPPSLEGINPSSADRPEKLAPVPMSAPRSYASSVSPEYAQLPNSSKTRGTRGTLAHSPVTPVFVAGTPTDQLIGSAPYEPSAQLQASTHVPTPKRGTSSLSRPGPVPQSTGRPLASPALSISLSPSPPSSVPSRTLSHSPPEDDEDERHVDDRLERHSRRHGGREHARERGTERESDRATQIRTTADAIPTHTNGYYARDGQHAYAGHHAGSGLTSVVAYRDDDLSHGRVPLLAPLPQPPNPMRKIAVIAAICTICLLLRTILLLTINSLGVDFSWFITLFYFLLSEILPLLAMLKVFNTPTPLVHVLGAGTGGGGAF